MTNFVISDRHSIRVNNHVSWIIACGFLLIEAAYVPQIVRLLRRKESEAISIFFPTTNLAGRLLVLSQTVALGDLTMTAGFLLGVLLRATLVFQVLYYRLKRRMEMFDEIRRDV